jgi:hypothetical protein
MAAKAQKPQKEEDPASIRLTRWLMAPKWLIF